MNIFYLDPDPATCSRYHCDKHVVKMILEYAQLLSTAHRVLDGTLEYGQKSNGHRIARWKLLNARMDQRLYKATHVNCPPAKWVRESIENYKWLSELLYFLCVEYTHRYNKVHLTQVKSIVSTLLNLPPSNIPSSSFFAPYPYMPLEYLSHDSLSSYHRYYDEGKYHLHSWTNRPTPPFITP